MKLRFFDFEVLPHWWLCVIGDYNGNLDAGIKNDFTVIHSDIPNARELLINKLRESDTVVLGYNIKAYDLIIANAIYNGFSPEQIKIVNDMIINPGCVWDTKEHMRLQSFRKKRLAGVVYQDLIDDDTGALKEKEAVLGLNIVESDVDFNKEVLTKEDKESLIYYCKHDVYATMYYYEHVRKPYIETKLAIGHTFSIPESACYMSTNAKLCGLVLGAKRCRFDDEFEDSVIIPSNIKEYIYDNMPNKLIENIRTNPYNISKTGSISSKTITEVLFENTISFGNGGVHSVLKPNLYVESNDEYVLMNIDGASFYPSLLIYMNLLSRAVSNPSYFKEIFETRMKLKWKKDKTPREVVDMASYKLVLNTTFGASGNKYLDLYDRYMCISCTRVGQLLLTAFTNKLYKRVPGLKVIQTNTDGVLVYFKRSQMPLVQALGKEWTNISNIQLEYEEINKIWQRDVNNYLLVKSNGKIKNCGAWLMDNINKVGYGTIGTLAFFACTKAAQKWLLEGKDLVNTIVENTTLSDFTMFCKKGPTFSSVVQRMSDGSEIKLQKCNRVIATKDTNYGMIYKVKMYKGNPSYHKMPNIPEHCKLVNEALCDYDFSKVRDELDYMWYIMYAADILNIPWVTVDNNIDINKLSKFRYE